MTKEDQRIERIRNRQSYDLFETIVLAHRKGGLLEVLQAVFDKTDELQMWEYASRADWAKESLRQVMIDYDILPEQRVQHARK